MNHIRQRFQQGSLRRKMRKSSPDVWEYRFRNHAEQGSPMRQITLSTTQYPTETKAQIALQAKVLQMNGSETFVARGEPTMGVVIDKYVAEERLAEIAALPPGEITITDGLAYATACVYKSLLKVHIRPRWGSLGLSKITPLAVEQWLKSMTLAPKSKGHVKRLLHLLFEKAMLWGLTEAQRNPIELVKLRGGSKRQKNPTVLTAEEFRALAVHLREPYRVMATVAMCTGMRISEVLALRWDRIDFNKCVLLVEQASYASRIGETKTDASKDGIPLDGDFRQVLLDWRLKHPYSDGLVFPSPVTGRCYHAGTIMKKHIRPAGKKAGLANVGWHSFRHSYRTLLNDVGASTGTQQGLMRHASVTTTMNVYGRASMQSKIEANSAVVRMVLSGPSKCA